MSKRFHRCVVLVLFSLLSRSLGCWLEPAVQDILGIERLSGASLEDEAVLVLAFHPPLLQFLFQRRREINVTFGILRLRRKDDEGRIAVRSLVVLPISPIEVSSNVNNI